MSSSPFEDKTFVDLMEAILQQSQNKKSVLCNAMAEAKDDSTTNLIPYYTLDCALTYLTYKEIKECDNPSPDILKKLEERAAENMNKMKQIHEKN